MHFKIDAIRMMALNNDLLQISRSHDIYFIMKMWAVLSPRLAKGERSDLITEKERKYIRVKRVRLVKDKETEDKTD